MGWRWSWGVEIGCFQVIMMIIFQEKNKNKSTRFNIPIKSLQLVGQVLAKVCLPACS